MLGRLKMAQRNKLAEAYLWGGYLPEGDGKRRSGSSVR